MEDAFTHIRQLIAQGEDTQARDLLRAEIRRNPSAEAYFLAAQVAYNDEQRLLFLESALELDPTHPGAREALAHTAPVPPPTPHPATPFDPFAFPARKPAAPTTTEHGKLADLSSRFVAFLIDTIILAIIGGVMGACVGVLYVTVSPGGSLPTNIALILSLFIQSMYYIYFMTTRNGQTPGKQMVNIRVVKKDGSPITATDAFLRNIIGYFISNLPLFLGFIWAFFDPERQGWHDKIANTVVVQVEKPQRDRLI